MKEKHKRWCRVVHVVQKVSNVTYLYGTLILVGRIFNMSIIWYND